MSLPFYIRSLKRYEAEFLEIDGYCISTTPITSTADPLFILSVKKAWAMLHPGNSNPATGNEARANMRVEISI